MAASDHFSPEQFKHHPKSAPLAISRNVWETTGVRRNRGAQVLPPTVNGMRKLADEYPTVGGKIGRVIDTTLKGNFNSKGALWPYLD